MNSIKNINSFYKKLKTRSPKLYIFLKDNKCLKKYGKNCNWIYKGGTIVDSFSWINTPEGDLYWRTKHCKYLVFLNEIYREL